MPSYLVPASFIASAFPRVSVEVLVVLASIHSYSAFKRVAVLRPVYLSSQASERAGVSHKPTKLFLSRVVDKAKAKDRDLITLFPIEIS